MSVAWAWACMCPSNFYCGMALGYADPQAAVNHLRSERAPVEAFASFRGFC